MRILHIHTQGGGVGYYRSFMPADALRRAGHDVTLLNNICEENFFFALEETKGGVNQWMLDKGWKHDVVHMGYSTVLSQVSCINGALRNYAQVGHDQDLPIAVDMDDDPHSVPTYNTSFKAFTRGAEELKTLLIQMRTADGISVTRQEVADALARDGKSFTVLPNYTHPPDWIDFPIDPNRKDDKSIRLMYVGGQGHYGDITTIEEELEVLMEKYDGKEGRPMLRLFWLGCTPDWAAQWMRDKSSPLANRSFYLQPCPLSTYHQLIRWVSPDILMAPLEHNTFNISKSDIKAYDAVCGEAAFVCSDWPTYRDVPDEVAFKHSTSSEWSEMVEALILDPSLREKKATHLKEWVLTNRCIDTHIYKWIDFYSKLRETAPVQGLHDVVRPRIVTGDEDV